MPDVEIKPQRYRDERPPAFFDELGHRGARRAAGHPVGT
jgi:hypothetical protein